MDTSAIKTNFQVGETGTGHPVICIHGNGLNRDLWRHLVPELSHKYRTIVYELRGMGKAISVDKAGAKITVQDHADDLGALLQALEIERAAIVAHAFGGFVAMRYALDQPARISALILACTSARMTGSTPQAVPAWVATAESEGMEGLVEKAIERWFVEPFRTANPEIMQLYREMIGANPPLGYAANGRGIMEYDLADEVHRISCPTLLISGDSDYSTPVQDHQYLAARIAQSELKIVPRASHTVPEEQAAEFNRMALDFLAKSRL